MYETDHDDRELDDNREHADKLAAYRSWTRFIAFVCVLVVAGVAALLLIIANRGGGDAAACERAVRGLVPGAFAGVDATMPRECKGLSDAQLERIGTKVLGETLGKVFGEGSS